MPLQPKIHHGFEHETMEAKIRGFLQFTPGERFEQMVGAIEFALLAQQSLKEQHATKVPRFAARTARSED